MQVNQLESDKQTDRKDTADKRQSVIQSLRRSFIIRNESVNDVVSQSVSPSVSRSVSHFQVIQSVS